MTKEIHEGWLASTHELRGRHFRHDRAFLEALRDNTLANGIPMTGHHDSRLTVDHTILEAQIKNTDDGELGLWVRFEIDKETWEQLGSPTGFSVAFFEDGSADWPTSNEPDLILAPDSYHWNDDDVREALELIARDFQVAGKRFHQLAGEPPAQIVLEVTMFLLTTLGPNLASSAIWDGIKLLWARSRRRPAEKNNVISINVQDGDRVCIARIETNNEEIAGRALETVADAVRRVFDTPSTEPTREVISYGDDEWKELG